MPVQNASVNIHRSQSNPRIHRRAASVHSNPLSAGPLPPPYGVQSMLKTTTETRDLQQFKPKKTHAQQSRNHIRPDEYRSSSFESSLPPSLRHSHASFYRLGRDQNRSGERPPSLRLTRPDLRHSRLSSRSFHPETRRYGSRMHNRHVRSPISLRSPSPSMNRDRTLLTLRSHGDIRSRYSGSLSNVSTHSNVLHYYALPSDEFYLKSPWHGRTHLNGTASRSSAPSSPAYMVKHRSNATYNHDLNRSTSSLTRHPSPALSNGYVVSRDGFCAARRGTVDHHYGAPRRHRPSNEVSASQRTSLGIDSLDGARYYDYTESFILEEDPASKSPFSKLEALQQPDESIEHSQPKPEIHRAQTPFGIRIGSSFCPAELSNETGVLREATSQMQCKSAEPAELDTNVVQMVPTRRSPEPVELDTSVRRISVASRRSRASPNRSIFFPNAERSQRHLVALAARVHSPEPESKLQFKSLASARFAVDCQDGRGIVPHEMVLSPGNAEPQSISRSAKLSLFEKRPKTSPLATNNRNAEIISPRPGRPMSSQSRKQFSKIIGLDIDLAIGLTTSSLKDKRLMIRELEDQEESTPLSNTNSTSASDTLKPAAEAEHLILADISHELLTPRREACLSMATSYGKSTVESLLDRHIECLGLMPESRSPSDHSSQSSVEQLENHDDGEQQLILSKTFSWPHLTHQTRLSTFSSYRRSSMSSETRMKLKPKRLFASMDGHISALPEPYDDRSYPRHFFRHDQRDFHSEGWQILPSTSQVVSDGALSRPTLASGDLADIDTELYPFGQKVWSLSQLSLPTSLEASQLASSRRGEKWHQHRRSRSDITARNSARHRRQFRVRMKQQHMSLVRRHTFVRDHRSAIRSVDASSASASEQSSTFEHAELAAEQPTRTCQNFELGIANQASPSVPSRWSSIIAAMPMPITGKPMFPRKISIRTTHSQRSQRSQVSLAEPLNSTRYRSQIRDLNSVLPVLASPDLGAPLDVSTFNLAVSRTGSPPLMQQSLNETTSYFHHGSPQNMPQRKEKRTFGLRPLRAAMQDARRASALAKAGLPVRDGNPTAAVGPCPPNSKKQHFDCHTTLLEPEIAPMSDFAYRKRKVVEKVRNWWRRQCMQKALSKRRAT